jgi:FKBP-type peptidyl-prolyl cis-trans isomerase
MKPTQTGIAVALALVVIAMFFIFPGLSPFNRAPQTQSLPTQESSSITMPTDTTATQNPDQLQVTDEVVGTGATAAAGDTVTVNYVGSFTDGKVFDASASHPETVSGFSFPLGAGRVIKGWDEGVAGMKEGGKRKLVVPASLGYGANDYGPIPGGSTLVFEVELLKVMKQ